MMMTEGRENLRCNGNVGRVPENISGLVRYDDSVSEAGYTCDDDSAGCQQKRDRVWTVSRLTKIQSEI